MSKIGPLVLVVEDEAAIGEMLGVVLAPAGFSVEVVTTAEKAVESINAKLPEVVLIDWMLPGMSGVQLAKRLRQEKRTAGLPLIMLTARGAESDRVTGLESGVDDYIAKPFSPRELIARIRALLRRRMPEHAGNVLNFAGVKLDPAAVSVTIDGRACELKAMEFKLIKMLMSQPGRVFSRGQLLDLVWGDHKDVEERTVDVSIRRLRAALGPRGESLIETVRGMGYRFTGQDQ